MNVRIIPAFDRNPRLIQQAQSPAGKFALLFLFAFPLWIQNPYWREILVVLFAVTYLPHYRRTILAIAAAAFAVFRPDWMDLDALARIANKEGVSGSFSIANLASAAIATVILLLALFGWAVFRFRKAWWLKRPLIVWHIFFSLVVLSAAFLPLSGVLRIWAWALTFALSGYFWCFCYTIADRAANDRDPLSLQEGAWRPAWMLGAGTSTPFVKGAAYLRRIEAKTAEELAITQWKGLKLMLWSVLLRLVLGGMNVALHGTSAITRIPTFTEAFSASISGHPLPALQCWGSLIAAFLEAILTMSIWGHQIVACCRMAGFRALRNTCRPLEARTIAEFWNRYYFYFKELLVDMFFYPTFLRYFKTQPRLRRFAATFTAASCGNMLFHFFRDISYCAELGLTKAITGFHVYAAYSVVLGTAIGVSQLRQDMKPRQERVTTAAGPAAWLRNRLWPAVCVSGFYCLLHIFDDTGRNYSLAQHARFLAGLAPFGR